MRKIVSFLVRYPVWVSVMMFTVVGFGLVALSQMRYSFFPEVPSSTIMITVAYPGASPTEVEEGVVLKIEEKLEGLRGVDRVTSISRENSASVTVQALQDYNINELLADVKNAVDGIVSFPVDAEKPVIYERAFSDRSVSVVLFGETDLYNLKYLADEFRDELLATDQISQVTINGLPSLEFAIDVSEADMRRYNLSFDEIASAISRANVNLSGGKFDTDEEEVLIRAWGKQYSSEKMLDIPVRGNPDGTVLYLRDIATVQERWADVPSQRYYNGHTAVILDVNQAESEDILAIADATQELADAFNETHDGVNALLIDDRTIPLRQRIELLVRNGMIGLILVILALGLFLNVRLSFWVSVGIPISFAGMFIIAGFAGITINVMSLFGMILVIGILVDDAIVVGENIFVHAERGKSPMQAAVDGTAQVGIPVLTSVATTMIIFTAFFFIDGIMGNFIWQMALVVIATLAFSLFEAFLILPAHLAHSKGLHVQEKPSRIRRRLEKGIQYLTHRIYAPSLRSALKHKWITVLIPVSLVLVTIGLLGGGLIGLTIFPEVDSDRVPINLTLVSGRQEADTDSLLAYIEDVCWVVADELRDEREDGQEVITAITRTIGSNGFGESGSHTGSLTVQLLDGEERQMDSYLIANRIRDAVGPIPEAQTLTYGVGGRFGKAVSISLLGNDLEQLDMARNLLKTELEEFSTLKDVTDTDQEGRREVDITLRPRAYALGLTLRDVAGQVRQGFYGQEIQRIQRGRDEIKVWVRFREEDRASLGQLDNMRIKTPDGAEYPFGELADYTIDRGITVINHLDRKREIRVEANQSNPDDDLPPILAEIETDVLPRVMSQVYGVKASFEGQSREQGKMVSSMMIAFPIALLSMFVMVVLVFRSYTQAILVFSLIPIGALGAIWGHGFHGLQVNMLSLIGMVALAGVIINDSIVLTDQINRNLRKGQTVYDAVYNAGLARLRPILLTTLTTALGLAPLIMETSRQAQFLIPMAISVAYGLVFGTFILLLILPAAFLVVSSVRTKIAGWTGKGPVAAEALEPAVIELNIPGLE